MKKRWTPDKVGGAIILTLFGLAIAYLLGLQFSPSHKLSEMKEDSEAAAESEYHPSFKAAADPRVINNQFFTLIPGTKFTYKGTSKDDPEHIEISVLPDEKQVMDVPVVVVHDQVWTHGVLKEDTYDYYAQDADGAVWYMGERVDNYVNGVLTNHNGSWEAGMNGALPGIIMPAKPTVGSSYRQEYLKGEAEDMGEILATDQTVTLSKATYTGCLKTRDWNLLESSPGEYKYYCPQVGFTTLVENISNLTDTEELTSIAK